MTSLEYLRQYKVFDFAIFDLLLSFLGIYLLSPLLSKIFLKIGIDIPVKNWLFLTLPIGILFHILFGIVTPMTKNFLDLKSHIILKIVIIILIFLGLKGIKLVK